MLSASDYLFQFQERAKQHGGPAPWTITLDFGKHTKHLLFGAITHGNETGSLPAIIRTIDNLQSGAIPYGGRVTFMLGNIEACRQDRRFIEADLNRVFIDTAPESQEKARARELMPIIDQADLFLDFHQTIEASESPFYIFTFHKDGYLWARLAGGSSKLITRAPGSAFSPKCACADEYAHNQGIPAITLEMGKKGLTPEADKIAYDAMSRCFVAMDNIANGKKLESQVNEQGPGEFSFFEIKHAEAFTSRGMHLEPELKNFTAVAAGQVVGYDPHTRNQLSVPLTGFLLFPKYPERDAAGHVNGPMPGEIYNLAVPMADHPYIAYGLTTSQATA